LRAVFNPIACFCALLGLRTRVFRKSLLAVIVVVLAGCGHAVVLQDPETGEMAQCNKESWLWGIWGSIDETKANEVCAEAYERAGWRRIN
jgi:hypothetical protein